jgi:hypothetical protein
VNTSDLLNDILYWTEFSDEEDLLAELQSSDPDVWAEYTLFAKMFSRCVDKLEVRNND